METTPDHLYSHDPKARRITIAALEELLKGAIDHGPVLTPDTKLYEKEGKFYRVIMPCLACLGKMQYDSSSPIVEVLEIDADSLYQY